MGILPHVHIAMVTVVSYVPTPKCPTCLVSKPTEQKNNNKLFGAELLDELRRIGCGKIKLNHASLKKSTNHLQMILKKDRSISNSFLPLRDIWAWLIVDVTFIASLAFSSLTDHYC